MRIVRRQPTLPALKELSVEFNPLGNDSRDRVLPQLSSRIENLSTPANELQATPDASPPVLAPIDHVALPVAPIEYQIELYATDNDGDAIRYEVSGLPQGVATITGNTLSINSSDLPGGNYRVAVTAIDVRNGKPLGRTSTQTFDVLQVPRGGGFRAENIYGKKLDQFGTPVEGWKIFLDASLGQTFSTLTDRNGEYSFSVQYLPFGGIPSWTLREESRPGWLPQSNYVFNPGSDSTSITYHDFVGQQLVRIDAVIGTAPNIRAISGPINEGQPATFIGIASPFDGTVPTYAWEVNGAPAGTDAVLAFTPSNEGRYAIKLTVTWPSGTVGTADFVSSTTYDLFVNNVAPTSVTGAVVGSLVEGGQLSLSASATDIDALSFEWDINGDGLYNEGITGANPTLTWSQLTALLSPSRRNGPSTGAIRLRAFDGLAYSESAPIDLPIGNAPPVANAGSPYSINEGSNLLLNASGSFDYGDPLSSLVYAWDVNGDGVDDLTTTQSQLALTWNQLNALGITDSGTARSMRLRVTDPEGAVATSVASLTVQNNAPTVTTINPPATIVEGETLRMSATWTDLAIDTHTVRWTVSRQNVTLATSTGLDLES